MAAALCCCCDRRPGTDQGIGTDRQRHTVLAGNSLERALLLGWMALIGAWGALLLGELHFE
jgi:hypothetical protein